jgi:hypothetical protein
MQPVEQQGDWLVFLQSQGRGEVGEGGERRGGKRKFWSSQTRVPLLDFDVETETKRGNQWAEEASTVVWKRQ